MTDSSPMVPELLAPAGTIATAEAAFNHGADAVYVGVGQCNLRAHAANLSLPELSALLDLSRSRAKKVYVTLNMMPDDAAMADIKQTIEALSRLAIPPDALIVSDPGVLACCRDLLPHTPLHLSTQTGVFSAAAMRFWKEQGVSRVILPRELTIDQVAVLAGSNLVETELFIHGAMCVSISGRCLIGAYIDGRHPNKGDCTQPCRLRYRIGPIDAGGKPSEPWFDAEESEGGVLLLNSKDLCALPILPDIIKTGVTSLKIEGRNKSLHYVATVVRVYRGAIDAWAADPTVFVVHDKWKKELDAVEHRPYTTGFYGGEHQLQAVYAPKSGVAVQMAGIVKGIMADGAPVIDVKSVFRPNDLLQVLPLNRKIGPYEISFVSLTDIAGTSLGYAPLNRLVLGRGVAGLRQGDIIRKVLA